MISSGALWPIIIVCLVLPFIAQFVLLLVEKIGCRSKSFLSRQVHYSKIGAWITRIKYLLLQVVLALTFYTFPYSLFVRNVDQNSAYQFNVAFHITQGVCVTLYIITSFMDPGLIAPSSLITEPANAKRIPLSYDTTNEAKNEATPLIDSTYYKFPFEPIPVDPSNPPICYCYECKTIPPLRARHDYASGTCVARYDHYSTWVGNAIGAKNHRFYVVLLLFETFVFVTAFCMKFDILVHIVNDSETRFVDPFGWVVIIFVLIYMFVISVMTIPSLAFHVWYISGNKTTPEVMKPEANHDFVKFINELDHHSEYETDGGEFNEGVMQNWWQLMKGFKDKPQYFYGLKCCVRLADAAAETDSGDA